MRLAAISDIHGNLAALDAVLDDIARSGVDVTVNLGDILSGPLWVPETADRLMALDLPTIAGNHERQVLTFAPERMGASDAHAAASIDEGHRAWLAGLPKTQQLSAQVLLCHGTPHDDLVYLQETTLPGYAGSHAPGVRRATRDEVNERLRDAMRGVPDALILCGHSHVPRVMRLEDGRLVVNPGSVGLQAYDDSHPHDHVIETGSPHARYALLTLRARGWQVEQRCVPYDHESAARLADSRGRRDWGDALRSGYVGTTMGRLPTV